MNRYHKKRLYAGIAIVIALTAMLTVSIFVIGQHVASGAETPPQPTETEKQTGRRIYLPDPASPEQEAAPSETEALPEETEGEAEETDNVVIRRAGNETEAHPEETETAPIPEETAPAETEEPLQPETQIPETQVPETKAPETEPPVPETEPPVPVTEPPVPVTEPPVPVTEPPAPVTEPPAPETEPPVPETEPPVPETEPPIPETEPPIPETEPPAPETEPPASGDPMYGPYGNFRYDIRSICGNDGLTNEQQDFIAKACKEYGVELELAYALMATESGFGYWRTHLNSNGTVDWGILQLNDCNLSLLQNEFPISSMADVIRDFETSVRAGLYVVQFAKNNVDKAGYDTDAWRVTLSYHYYIVDAEKKWNNYGWTCEQDAMEDAYCSIVMGWYHKFLDAKFAYDSSLPAAG